MSVSQKIICRQLTPFGFLFATPTIFYGIVKQRETDISLSELDGKKPQINVTLLKHQIAYAVLQIFE